MWTAQLTQPAQLPRRARRDVYVTARVLSSAAYFDVRLVDVGAARRGPCAMPGGPSPSPEPPAHDVIEPTSNRPRARVDQAPGPRWAVGSSSPALPANDSGSSSAGGNGRSPGARAQLSLVRMVPAVKRASTSAACEGPRFVARFRQEATLRFASLSHPNITQYHRSRCRAALLLVMALVFVNILARGP